MLDQLGLTILSDNPGNPLLWDFLMQNFNVGSDALNAALNVSEK